MHKAAFIFQKELSCVKFFGAALSFKKGGKNT
jgi:hypothetical protein